MLRVFSGEGFYAWNSVEAPKLLKLNNFQQPAKIFLYFIGEHFKVPRPDAHVNIDVTIAIEFDSRFICYYTEKTMILSDSI